MYMHSKQTVMSLEQSCLSLEMAHEGLLLVMHGLLSPCANVKSFENHNFSTLQSVKVWCQSQLA